jgi:hypothetical protein
MPEAQIEETLPAPQPRPNALRRYLRDSRGLLNSLVLVMPLFIIYQVGILTTDGIRNGVDFITPLIYRDLFNGVTLHYLLFNLGVMLVLGMGIFLLRKNQRFHPKTFFLVMAEGTTYGLLLGTLVNVILNKIGVPLDMSAGALEQMGAWGNFVLSLGAGLYEELVFRLFMLGGSVWFIQGLLRMRAAGPEQPKGLALARRCFFGQAEGPEAAPRLDMPTRILLVAGAVVITSLIFSGIHYVGELGDPLTLRSFMFRFVAGAIFAVLFYLRGFAVAVYTHAIYDVIVLVF